MKIKTKNSTALLIVTLLILVTSCFTLETGIFKAKADTTEQTDQKNYTKSYFKNLTENFGSNDQDSCVFVAAGMLLSYYDTALCDDIIPESYDVPAVSTNPNFYNTGNSPGIRRESIPGASDMTVSQYLDVVHNLADTYLHCKLIDMSPYKERYANFWGSVDTLPGEIRDIVETYLQEVAGFEKDIDFSLDYSGNIFVPTPEQQEIKKNHCIEKIKEGQPVILFLSGNNSKGSESARSIIPNGGHTVIAYDYNEDEDKFLCHFGWHDGGFVVDASPESQGYVNYHGYLAIDWNIEHTCSNNYVVNGTPYCYKHKDLTVYNHLCSYTDGYQTFPMTDSNEHTKHKKMCHCTNYVVENHTSSCGCTRSSHQTNTYSYYNSTKHSSICYICGEVYYGNHVVQIKNPSYCIACESYFDSGFGEIIHPNNLNGRLVTANGSYVGLYGIIYLDDRDIEAYFNGTLVFYKENSSAQTA